MHGACRGVVGELTIIRLGDGGCVCDGLVVSFKHLLLFGDVEKRLVLERVQNPVRAFFFGEKEGGYGEGGMKRLAIKGELPKAVRKEQVWEWFKINNHVGNVVDVLVKLL